MTNQKVVDGWSEGFRDRFSEIIDAAGGLSAAADIAETSHDSIANYRDGKTKIPMIVATRLCFATGVSIDYLAGLPTRSDGQYVSVSSVEICFPKWATIIRQLKHFDADEETPSFVEDLLGTERKLAQQGGDRDKNRKATNG